LSNAGRSPTRFHAFVVRIWWESDSLRPGGRPLWRGRVQHVTSGEYVVFQSLGELMRFIIPRRRAPLRFDEDEV